MISLFCVHGPPTRRAWMAAALLAALFATAGRSCASEADGARRAVMPGGHAELFASHCYACHDADSQEAGVNLEGLSYEVSESIENAELWQKVLNVINSGEMPPEDSDPLPDAAKAQFLEDLTAQMVLARSILTDSGGVIPLRRLNRREYENTVEALLGVRPDVTSLPSDQVGSGFDTQGASLFVSSDQLENYLAAAERALRLCLLPSPPAKKTTRRVEPEERLTRHYRKYLNKLVEAEKRAKAWKAQEGDRPPSDFGLEDEYAAKKKLKQRREWGPQIAEYLERPETKHGATLILTIKAGGPTRVKIPLLSADEPGRYKVRFRAAHYPDADERFHYVELTSGVDKNRKRLGWRKVTATLDDPQVLEFEVDHRPGEEQQLWLHQRTHQDRGDKNLWTLNRKKNGIGTLPGVWIDWAEVTGPERNDAPRRAAERILIERPKRVGDDRYAAEVMRRFAVRAFRGTEPEPAFLKRLQERYRANRKAGQPLTEALIQPLAIILSSPDFLYMVEAEDDSGRRELSGTELAVRLSYFLWSTQPDNQLMRLARAGRLSDPAVLHEQTERMLADPRHDRFVRDFTHQWLSMDRLGMFQFNGAQFPVFDNAARENAREEVFQTVAHVMDQDLPVGTLLDADFVVVNDLMAGYYGIPGVEGHAFRKVPVGSESPRGGLLGTAAVMAMGSDGLRSSPVERGAWVLRHLLHDPPAPAPPNVPQLSRLAGKTLSARELQQAHQEQPQCAQCHRKIDPIGYGLENFSAVGLWREKEEVGFGKKRAGRFRKSAKFPIDPSGRLPGGETFTSFLELRDAVAGYKEPFARGFTEHLIAYGLGRPYGFSDQELAEGVMREAAEANYPIKAFIHALVQSDTFQTR